MWIFRSEPLHAQRALRFTVHLNSQPATVADVLRGWRNDADFRTLFNAHLAGAPYSASRGLTCASTIGQSITGTLLTELSSDPLNEAVKVAQNVSEVFT